MVQNLSDAVQGYEKEYRRLPLPVDFPGDTWMPTTAKHPAAMKMLHAIFGQSRGAKINPRRIVFLDAERAEVPRDGYFEMGDPYVPSGLYDPWGRPLYIMVPKRGEGEKDRPSFLIMSLGQGGKVLDDGNPNVRARGVLRSWDEAKGE